MASRNIEVRGVKIHFSIVRDKDYVSLTDIAKQSDRNEAKYLIRNWMKNNSTLEFLTAWEGLFNPDFIKGAHLDPLLRDFRKNATVLTPSKWIESTNAVGIIVKNGRNGGVYAHQDIALEFCSWLNPTFKVYLIKAFQELMEKEYHRKNLEWHISKITDNVEEIRNLLDTIPGQNPQRNRLRYLEE
ncbi:MAG: KilA-N domain-containing protein [Bacteroidota bacterium]